MVGKKNIEPRTAEKDTSDNETSPTYVPVKEKYMALWIPDPKATSCMMSGCTTKFNVFNRRHHCRECGWVYIFAFHFLIFIFVI